LIISIKMPVFSNPEGVLPVKLNKRQFVQSKNVIKAIVLKTPNLTKYCTGLATSPHHRSPEIWVVSRFFFK